MKYLSLFSGIGGFEKGIQQVHPDWECVGYSEIDKYATSVYQKHFPAHKNYGDITQIDVESLPDFDLLVGGSPCQDLSIAKNNRQGLSGARSGLFYKYLEILRVKKPRYFVLENVASMPKEARETISKELGVEPVMINAALVSAQNRKRLFWANFPINQPEDKGIFLKDILEESVNEKYVVNISPKYGLKGLVDAMGKSKSITASSYKGYGNDGVSLIRVGQLGNGGQGERVYSPKGKAVSLSANGGGLGAKTGLYVVAPVALRNRGDGKKPEFNKTNKANSLTTVVTDSMVLVAPNGKQIILGDQELQVLKEQRTELGKQSRKEIRQETGRDSTLRSKDHKAYYGREGLKANCITTGISAESMIVQDFVIRKLTPVECARLQCFPDDWCEGLSDTRQYMAYGNAVNVSVIEHIFNQLV